MADAPTRRRKKPLEERNKTLLGVGAIAVVAVVVGAMLMVQLANIGYRHYAAKFLQAAALQVGNPIVVAGIPVGEVTSMYQMFTSCAAFNSDLSGWDTSRVTDMPYMFSGASSFNGNVSTW